MTAIMPLLGRCKQCDYTLFATRDQVTECDDFYAVRSGTGAYHVKDSGFFARCPERHRVFVLKAIKGTYSPDHKCDSRCLNAKGHTCTCSCGGANHGRGHAVAVVEQTAATPAPTVEPATQKQEAFIRRLLDERVLPERDGQTGEERRHVALTKLNQGLFTKKQASNTIEWLLSLPIKEA